jgi:GT2 family glycosyltransferase
MENTDNTLAYIIPTKDRPDELRCLLASLRTQTAMPDQIIVVDGSQPDIKPVIKEFTDFNITYVRVFPPSLAKQRNAGIAAVESAITLAGFLDDDLVLEPNATEKMLAFWDKTDEKTGGAGFAVVNQPIAFSSKVGRLFNIDHPKPGRILKSGFQSQIPPLSTLTETDWIYGGATVWRRAVINQFSYDDWYMGHGYLEDVDFSYRVKQLYKLYIIGGADVYHYSKPIIITAEFMIGKQQVLNRYYFVKKIGHFSNLAFAWGLFGQLLFNLISSLRRINTAGLRRAAGNITGLMYLMINRNQQIGGFYK